MLVELHGKDWQTVVNALIKNAGELPQELYKSLLLRSTEPWQRGATEYTNGLLRQYLPKRRPLALLAAAAQCDSETMEPEAAKDGLGFHTLAVMFSDRVAVNN